MGRKPSAKNASWADVIASRKPGRGQRRSAPRCVAARGSASPSACSARVGAHRRSGHVAARHASRDTAPQADPRAASQLPRQRRSSRPRSKPHPQADLPPLPLPGYAPPRPPEVVTAAYQFAAEHPEILSYVPCFCGCERSGHKGNEDCFVRTRGANGDVDRVGPSTASSAPSASTWRRRSRADARVRRLGARHPRRRSSKECSDGGAEPRAHADARPAQR